MYNGFFTRFLPKSLLSLLLLLLLPLSGQHHFVDGFVATKGLRASVYRRELSLDLNKSSDSAVTTSCGSLFQSDMVLGKNDILL